MGLMELDAMTINDKLGSGCAVVTPYELNGVSFGKLGVTVYGVAGRDIPELLAETARSGATTHKAARALSQQRVRAAMEYRGGAPSACLSQASRTTAKARRTSSSAAAGFFGSGREM